MATIEHYEKEILKYLVASENGYSELKDVVVKFRFTKKQTDLLVDRLLKRDDIRAEQGMGSHYKYQAIKITETGRARISQDTQEGE